MSVFVFRSGKFPCIEGLALRLEYSLFFRYSFRAWIVAKTFSKEKFFGNSGNLFFKVFERQKEDNRDKKTIYGKIIRREAENALWLMRIMTASGRKRELWDIRKAVLASAGKGIFSSPPVSVRSKLLGMTVMPHVYFAMLRKRIKEDNE